MTVDGLPAKSEAHDTVGVEGPCILVTGGAGYVGSHAVLELLDSGFRAVVLDDSLRGFVGRSIHVRP